MSRDKVSFESFFREKERRGFSLFDLRNPTKNVQQNVVSSLLLFLITLGILAIGFANGSLTYLSRKMEDPFVTWLDLLAPRDFLDDPKSLVDSLLSTNFGISSVNVYQPIWILVWDKKAKGSHYSRGRTIQVDDQILGRISDIEYLVKGEIFLDERDVGLIVTKLFMEKYGYDENDPFIQMVYDTEENEDELVLLPVRAVVEELPGGYEFLVTPYFRYQLYSSFQQPFNPVHTERQGELWIFLPTSKELAWTSRESLDQILRTHYSRSEYELLKPYVSDPQEYDEAFRKGFVVTISFLKEVTLDYLKDLFGVIKRWPSMNNFELYHLYFHPFDNRAFRQKNEKLSINLSTLDRIAVLKKHLATKYKVDIDVAKVESLENYRYITKMTISLSWSIIVLSIVATSIVIFYDLLMKLYRRRRYFGSLKAFGLQGKRLRKFYMKMMFTLLAKAILVGLTIATLIGYSGGVRAIWSFFAAVDANSLYFEFFDFDDPSRLRNFSLPAFLLMLCLGIWISIDIAARKILKYDAGDLIRDRIDL